MIKLDVDKIKLLHQLIAEETGGSIGVRDERLLDSAVEGIYQTFDGKELYPSKEEKAAQLGFSLISNHAFVDGNKRIGMLVMMSFLEINGIHMNCNNDDIYNAGISVAGGKMDYDGLLDFIKSHKV